MTIVSPHVPVVSTHTRVNVSRYVALEACRRREPDVIFTHPVRTVTVPTTPLAFVRALMADSVTPPTLAA